MDLQVFNLFGLVLGAFVVLGALVFEAIEQRDWPLLIVFVDWALLLLRTAILYAFSTSTSVGGCAGFRSALPEWLEWMRSNLCVTGLVVVTDAGALAFLYRDLWHKRWQRKQLKQEKDGPI